MCRHSFAPFNRYWCVDTSGTWSCRHPYTDNEAHSHVVNGVKTLIYTFWTRSFPDVCLHAHTQTFRQTDMQTLRYTKPSIDTHKHTGVHRRCRHRSHQYAPRQLSKHERMPGAISHWTAGTAIAGCLAAARPLGSAMPAPVAGVPS